MTGEKEKALPPESKRSNKMVLLILLIFLGGMFTAFLLRFIFVDAQHTHYHANFALYVNGQRDNFESFTNYEEVAACSAEGSDNPKSRVHMHDQVNHVVHVHDTAVTWGHFFANLGYTLGNKVLVTNAGVFTDGQDGKNLRFILNGQPASAISNQTIKSEDVLLVDYGNDDASVLQQRYDGIEKDAHDFNLKNDPGACSGALTETFTQRVKRTIGIESSH